MITGPEVAAAGRVLTQTARAVVSGDSSGALKSRRAAAYSEFQAAILGLLTWAETSEAMQRSMSPGWRDALAAATAVVPVAVLRPSSPVGIVARELRPVALIAYAARVAERVDYDRQARAELDKLRDVVARGLAALADVRLSGGREQVQIAEEMTALVGELLGELPVVTDQFVRLATSNSTRRDKLRDALGFHGRRFSDAARRDLSPLRWRRRARTSFLTFYRPKPSTGRATTIDIDELLNAAANPTGLA